AAVNVRRRLASFMIVAIPVKARGGAFGARYYSELPVRSSDGAPIDDILAASDRCGAIRGSVPRVPYSRQSQSSCGERETHGSRQLHAAAALLLGRQVCSLAAPRPTPILVSYWTVRESPTGCPRFATGVAASCATRHTDAVTEPAYRFELPETLAQ